MESIQTFKCNFLSKKSDILDSSLLKKIDWSTNIFTMNLTYLVL